MRTRTLRAVTGVLLPSLVAKLGLLSPTGYDAPTGVAHGVLYGWGDNQGFGLGDGTTQNRTRPVPIPGMQDVVSVASGGAGGLAAKSDGTLWTWGSESAGQLGERRRAAGP